jgi:tetratricopeptide (TPR) repeat protein
MFRRDAALVLCFTPAFLGLWFLAASSGGTFADEPAKAVYQKLLHATACIEKPDGSWGSGWVVDRERKLLVTNDHVIVGYSPAVERVGVLFPVFKNGQLVVERKRYADVPRLRAQVVDTDRPRDLAVIQLLDPLPEGTTELQLAAQSAEPADRVHTLGNPAASDGMWIYTSGTVRQIFEWEWFHDFPGRKARDWRKAKILQTQSPLSPGDSGGPVVNDQGELEAVHSSGNSDGKLISIHIDVSEVRPFVEQSRRVLEPKNHADALWVGQRLLQREKWKDAAAAFTRVIQEDAKCAAAYRDRARAFYELKDYDTALVDLDQAMKLDATDAVAHYYRGFSLHWKGEPDKALSHLSRAVALNPQYAHAYNQRGLIYRAKGDYRRAEAEYTRAIEANPKVAVFWANRGQVRMELKEYQEALADCSTAIEFNPFDTYGWRNRGACLRQLKLYEQQVKNFQLAAEKLPDNPNVWCWLGDAYTWIPQWDKAIGCYSKALELDKDLAYGYWGRGGALEKSDRVDLAQADYRKAIDLNPKEYKERLKTYHTAYLRVFNDTNEPVRIALQYELQTKDGQWVWYPKEPSKGTKWTLIPGQKTRLNDDGWVIHCRRYRLWADGLNSKGAWDQPKDKDWRTCPDEGYLARERPAFLHRLSK